jgi:hypothetical protein
MSEFHQTVALSYFEHVERQIQLAVTKASFLVAALSILLTAYLRAVVDLRFFGSLESAVRKGDIGEAAYHASTATFMLCGVFLVSALVCAILGTLPKVLPNRRGGPDDHAIGNNVLFYGFIATLTPTKFYEAFKLERHEQLERDLLLQACGKAKWLRHMYKWLNAASLLTVAALVGGAVVLLHNLHILDAKPAC